MNKELFKENLKLKADMIDVHLDDNQLEEFWNYKEMVLEWNNKINLTAIIDDEDFINKHFIDSLTIAKYIPKQKGKMIDIGTGAGFPGIPLKIVNKDIEIVLFDALNKRLKVLEEIINSLKLKNIYTLHGRAEETFRNIEYREKYDIATSRAVANLSTLVEYMLPSVKVGGVCICMKAGNVEEEIEKAKNAIKVLGGKIEKVENIVLPKTEIERTIIVIKKVSKTPNKYPRKPGIPNKEPIE